MGNDDDRPRTYTAADIVLLAEAATAAARERFEATMRGEEPPPPPEMPQFPPRPPRPPLPPRTVPQLIEVAVPEPEPEPEMVVRKRHPVLTFVKLVLTVVLTILIIVGLPALAVVLLAD